MDSITIFTIGLVISVILIIIFLLSREAFIARENKEFHRLCNENDLFYEARWTWDKQIKVKTRPTMQNYTVQKYISEDSHVLNCIDEIFKVKEQREERLKKRFENFISHKTEISKKIFARVEETFKDNIKYCNYYIVDVVLIGTKDYRIYEKDHYYLYISRKDLECYKSHPELYMTKGKYNSLVKEQNKKALNDKIRYYCDKINVIIDKANDKDSLFLPNSSNICDEAVKNLTQKALLNGLLKIKNIDDERFSVVDELITQEAQKVNKIYDDNDRVAQYYNSDEFTTLKATCDNLMASQKDFNNYIDEKVQRISSLFGKGDNIIRLETINEDTNNYLRPYKKTISPFTADVSSQVFASAENEPLKYLVKLFYKDEALYPKQIEQLYFLIEELETLKDAKEIIENSKKDVSKYLSNVPSYIMELDKDGFYHKLGFALIGENQLVVEYKISYTSEGGKAQRNFSIPMTEENIIKLIDVLKEKLSDKEFIKKQRRLMTAKLREEIKKRDNYTCRYCGNSVKKEPNLLLEIDHIIPVTKGGETVIDNLQCLCWRCNRSKSDKMISEANNA